MNIVRGRESSVCKEEKENFVSFHLAVLLFKSISCTSGDGHDIGTAGSCTPTGAGRRSVVPPCPSTTALVRGFLVLLFEVHLGVPLSLVTPRKLASTEFARERLLAGVCADVRS